MNKLVRGLRGAALRRWSVGGACALALCTSAVAQVSEETSIEIEGGDLAQGAATAVFLFPALVGVAVLMLRLARRTETT